MIITSNQLFKMNNNLLFYGKHHKLAETMDAGIFINWVDYSLNNKEW